jgi:Cd2+/Zn2+-exporting ATPase
MKNILKKHGYIIFISSLFILSMIFNELNQSRLVSFIIMTLLTIFAGFHIFKKAFMDLKYKIIGIDLLVTIAVIAAYMIGDLFEAAAVTYLFTLGHYLEKMSLEKTRSSLKAMMDLKPLQARLITLNKEDMVSLDSLKVGDILLVKVGEKIPTDGIIIEGNVFIDEQMMTGESMPVEKDISDAIIGSTVVTSGYLKMRVTKVGEDTTLSRMIHMVEEAQDSKAKTQKFMEVFSKYYTPLIVIFSIFIFIMTKDIRLSITMLVIACPGALVIATPVSFVAGIGNAAKKGILFKGGDSIEKLSKGEIVFFDKTGTLTKGKPEVVEIKTFHISEEELIKIASIGEAYSEHPIAHAIIQEAMKNHVDIKDKPKNYQSIKGKGIKFSYQDKIYSLGNERILENPLMGEYQMAYHKFLNVGYTTLLLANENQVLGLIGIADTLRPKTELLMKDLKSLGIKKTVMLTGDQEIVAHQIANQLGIDDVNANLYPEDKAQIIKSYQDEYHTIFVGDGINDALALSYADASVAVGGIGKDLAMETADVVLMSEDIGKLKDAIKISRKVKINMIQNIIFALSVVFFLMIGVLLNQVTMSLGMLVHEGSVLIVIINAIRLLRFDIGGNHVKRLRTKQLHQESSHL